MKPSIFRTTSACPVLGKTRRGILLGLALAVGVGACGEDDDLDFGACEQATAVLRLRTADGQATIARVELEPIFPGRACTTSSPCGPMTPADAGSAACAELDVVSWGALGCSVRLTSLSGKVVTVESG